MINNFCSRCGAPLTNLGVSNSNFCPSCGNCLNLNAINNTAERFTLKSAFVSMFKKYAQFSGRSRRSEYWFAYLANCLLILASLIIMAIVGVLTTVLSPALSMLFYYFFTLFLIAYYFGLLVPWLALTVRRLHDTGKSGWFLLFSLIPYIGGIIIFIFSVMDSDPLTNKYGTCPKINNKTNSFTDIENAN